MIDVGDIDKNVLLLAEFLGVEQLLLAVKIRAYRNLHPGQVAPLSDEQTAMWFNKKYGGIREALSSGVLPGSLAKEVALQKEFAIMDLEPRMATNRTDHVNISMDINRSNQPNLQNVHIIGALNWLNHHGYTKHETQLDTECRNGRTMVSTCARIACIHWSDA